MNDSCKICGASTEELYDAQLELNFYYCNTCEFISQDQMSLVSSEEEKQEYDLHNNSYEDENYLNMFRRFLTESVVPFSPKGKNALDFGSGPEPVLARLLAEEYGYKTDIYDLFYSPEKVYEEKQYDLITCTEVVEHLKNPLEYFTLFKTLLKENGLLALMTKFHPNDNKKFCQWYYRREKSHISFYTPKTMETIAQIVDLKVRYFNSKNYCSLSHK